MVEGLKDELVIYLCLYMFLRRDYGTAAELLISALGTLSSVDYVPWMPLKMHSGTTQEVGYGHHVDL
ncbi:hypothetical protein SCLCIDRAFT_1211265 [Scleroderma citrinum Foug A]|uniref:Uncharacterized protein n=1 Tax=Scleroderma citrinum Foug A TaxID=1036808 RepID=A0A0C3ANG0_9AGAM|nr:hypothetical protein SCLCIDRAFT_1211265 [Scleroderma citrinum Foug A]